MSQSCWDRWDRYWGQSMIYRGVSLSMGKFRQPRNFPYALNYVCLMSTYSLDDLSPSCWCCGFVHWSTLISKCCPHLHFYDHIRERCVVNYVCSMSMYSLEVIYHLVQMLVRALMNHYVSILYLLCNFIEAHHFRIKRCAVPIKTVWYSYFSCNATVTQIARCDKSYFSTGLCFPLLQFGKLKNIYFMQFFFVDTCKQSKQTN